MKVKINKNSVKLISLFFMISGLLLAAAVVTQPQRIKQFAQETFSEPPLYGCLQVGEGNKSSCASRLGIATAFTLQLHGRPLEKQTTVYYGDRITGSMKFTNVGDVPIQLKNIGLSAIAKEKNDARDFKPLRGQITLPPRESVTLSNASYVFKSPDSNKEWTVGSKITTTGGEIPTADTKKRISVNATCTALRVQELTEKDKKNIKTYCGKNAKSKLCSSKQYCEIFNGSNCGQSNVSDETPGWQCDPAVYLPKAEQDLLEELCKVYPDTDACKNFCDRTVNTAICPQKYLFVDTSTGKAIRLDNKRAIYVRNPDNYQFEYSDKYPAAKTKMSAPKPPPAKTVMGVKSVNMNIADHTINGKSLLADGPLRPVAGCDRNCLYGSAPPAAFLKTPPPRRSEPLGAQPGDPKVERNNQRPDPTKMRFVDPNNPNGSLTLARTAEFGDFGYNPGCGSGRGDANPNDDPAGAPQAACCANSMALREGCCSEQCTVWSQKSKDGKLRDGNGNVCTNDPDASRASNTCSMNPDKAAVRREIIPANLEGQGAFQPEPPKVPANIFGPQPGPGGQPIPPAQPAPPAPDVICHNQGMWYNASGEGGSCIPPAGNTPLNSVPDNQDAQCGWSSSYVGNSGASNCCANTCSSKSCHIPNPIGGPISCGVAQTAFAGLGSEYTIYDGTHIPPSQNGPAPVNPQPAQPAPQPAQPVPPAQPGMHFTQPGLQPGQGGYTGRLACVGGDSKAKQVDTCKTNTCGFFESDCTARCTAEYDSKWNDCSVRNGVPAN